MTSEHDPLHGWIPLYLKQAQVHWGYMGNERFSEPFCLDTLQRLANRPFNQLLLQSTNLELLVERSTTHPGLPLGGIIFHMGRCGSTLVAQALACLSDVVMLSEPPALHTLLGWLVNAPELDPTAGSAFLRGLISAMGQPRRSSDQRLFMKTDGFHICHCDRILAAFPDVPWIFIYRHPLEVLVSQSRRLNAFTVPGALVDHGVIPPAEVFSTLMEHTAWILSQTLQAAIDAFHRHPHGLLLNYSELPNALDTRILPHLHLSLQAADLAPWQAIRSRDSKHPQRVFSPDSAEKQTSAGSDVRAAAQRWLEAPYAELERLRLQQESGG